MSRRHVNAASNEPQNIVHVRGQPCVVVIDPATCMLRIPLAHVHKTRAQNRNGLPSLCQLYLNNRCRQGVNCFQVHADLSVVAALRSEVGCLPYCCVAHGDIDRLGIHHTDSREPPCTASNDRKSKKMDDVSAELPNKTRPSASILEYSLKDFVLHIPGCTVTSCDSLTDGSDDKLPFVPIDRCSYTLALHCLLLEHKMRNTPTLWTVKDGNNVKVVLDASSVILCRMHVLDRCLYGEECKFLHLCKQIALANPELVHAMGLQIENRQLVRSLHYATCVSYPSLPAPAPAPAPLQPWHTPSGPSPPFFASPPIALPMNGPPSGGEMSAGVGVPSMQTAAQPSSHPIPKTFQPHSIDSCPDVNVALSFSALINERAGLSSDEPGRAANSSLSDSSKLSLENANKNNESYASLNFSGSVAPVAGKLTLSNKPHTLMKNFEHYRSHTEQEQYSYFGTDPTEATPVGVDHTAQGFRFQGCPKHRMPALFEKSSVLHRNANHWQHNPYSGVMLDSIKFRCKNDSSMKSNA